MNLKKQTLIDNARVIIFDFDGVIIDSIPYFRKSKQQLMKKYGVLPEQLETINTLGMGMKDIMYIYKNMFSLHENPETLVQQWRKTLYELLLTPGNIKQIEYTLPFIKSVYETKPLAVATGGHPKQMVKKLLQLLHAEQYFSFIISSEDDVARGKPHPDVYLFTAKRLEVESKDCLVIEDSANGTIAAKKAGMNVIGVNKEEYLRKQLYEAGADVVVSNLGEF